MITHQEALDTYDYNPVTGVFHRHMKSGKFKESGTTSGHGYLQITFNGGLYYAHRLAWFYIHGEWPSAEIDHINRVKDDNRLSNLRSVTKTENLKNMPKFKNNTSGVTGVHWSKLSGKWSAYIQLEGKRMHLGFFTDKSDAIAARKAAEIKYGFHKNHGRIISTTK